MSLMLPAGVVQQQGGGGVASFAVDTDGDLVSKLLFYSFQEDGTDASGNVADGTEANVTHSAGIIGNKGVYNGTSSEMNFGNVLDFERTDSLPPLRVANLLFNTFNVIIHNKFSFLNIPNCSLL